MVVVTAPPHLADRVWMEGLCVILTARHHFCVWVLRAGAAVWISQHYINAYAKLAITMPHSKTTLHLKLWMAFLFLLVVQTSFQRGLESLPGIKPAPLHLPNMFTTNH